MRKLWLLCMTRSPVLLAQFISCPSEALNIATAYMGCAGLFPDFIAQVTANFRDMDAIYVISWQDWFPKLAPLHACVSHEARR